MILQAGLTECTEFSGSVDGLGIRTDFRDYEKTVRSTEPHAGQKNSVAVQPAWLAGSGEIIRASSQYPSCKREYMGGIGPVDLDLW